LAFVHTFITEHLRNTKLSTISDTCAVPADRAFPFFCKTALFLWDDLCYDKGHEVITLDEMKQEAQQFPEETGYTPRPRYQVWAARVALVLFLLIVIYQLLSIAGGGL